MQCAVHNHATIRVADRTGLSGRATADEVNLDRFHNRIRKVCAVVGATLILSAAAYAQGNSPLAALQAQITALQSQVQALQAQVAALQSSTSGLQALQAQVAAIQANPALALGSYVIVDTTNKEENGVNGPNITFKGANIHIVSGSGATDDNLSHGGSLTGLGNLIIGYDELGTNQVPNRGGSHNLVIGRFHTFTSSAFEGLVAGEFNTISNQGASVSGGDGNTASGPEASVSGGQFNTASGNFASVSGGGSLFANFSNIASGRGASVSGGSINTATGDFSSILGGANNIVSTPFGHFP
jgi:hypothetical protein